MSSAFPGWLFCYCVLLPGCLLQVTLESLSFFKPTSLEIYLSNSKQIPGSTPCLVFAQPCSALAPGWTRCLWDSCRDLERYML